MTVTNETKAIRLLIINRGEAARRAIRAARDCTSLGTIRTIALYTDADRGNLFIREADEALFMAGSYLDLEALRAALIESRATHAWVGWGFVAERAEFADLCAEIGVTFIGPTPQAMRRLGDKISAKQLAEVARVEVSPWSGGAVDESNIVAHAKNIGFPLMVKASAGGGGRGVRKVMKEADLLSSFIAARNEAERAFGDGRIYIESMIDGARHIEVQIAADHHGHVLSFGTRDCTLQRRHQKVIEQSPATLSDERRSAVEAAAVRLATEAGYRNLGTVEFLFKSDSAGDHFYFMEMNARIQVEHTVTEVTSGVDLAVLQLEIAAGKILDKAPPLRGYAIEARLNAEDPAQDFAPAPGKLELLRLPSGPGVRVDAGYSEGDTVPAVFDSMVAKIIGFGATREAALQCLRRALSETRVLVHGGTTNRAFLAALAANPDVANENITIQWLDKQPASVPPERERELARAACAIVLYDQQRSSEIARFVIDARRGRLTMNDAASSRVVLRDGRRLYHMDVRQEDAQRYQVARLHVEVERHSAREWVLRTQGESYNLLLGRAGAEFAVEVGDYAFRLSEPQGDAVVAPAPGLIVSVAVAVGDTVEAGELVAVMEAMKSEIVVRAQTGGHVRALRVNAGQHVAGGAVLLELDRDSATEPEIVIGAAPASSEPDWRICERLIGGYDVDLSAAPTSGAQDNAQRFQVVHALIDLLTLFSVPVPLHKEGHTDIETALVDLMRAPQDASRRYAAPFVDTVTRALKRHGASLQDDRLGAPFSRMVRAHTRLPGAQDRFIAMIGAVDFSQLEKDAAAQAQWQEAMATLSEVSADELPRLYDYARHVRFSLLTKARLAVEIDRSQIELHRLSAFETTPLPAAPDVLLLHATAKENPKDERLLAYVQVPDRAALEHRVLEAVAAMRAQLQKHVAAPPMWNRLTVFLQVPIIATRGIRSRIARMTPALRHLGLEKIVVRVVVEGAGDSPSSEDRTIQFHFADDRIATVQEGAPSVAPLQPHTPYTQKVWRLRRRDLTYPYEIVRMLSGDGTGPYPRGTFEEWDLDSTGRLAPVSRPHGENRCGMVVGLVTNFTALVPEGMKRVILLGDPSLDMGSLAEPECRRVIAAIDNAEALGVPLDWFPVSSGAAIAMHSGTENLDWTARALRRIVEFTQRGGEINLVVDALSVGAQSYWNAEATMLMHCRGVLIMTPRGAMVLTGKRALELSGGVSARDHQAIGGLERIMGPNGEAQYAAQDLAEAVHILFRYYERTYVVPGESRPRLRPTVDESTRLVELAAFTNNPGRKKPFDIREVMRAVMDSDDTPLERWTPWRNAEMAVIWDAHVGGAAVSIIGVESKPRVRLGFVPADGPEQWTPGTLFPRSSKKIARALNAASGRRPVVVLANLSGFDGSPESLRRLQLEYGAEIGRAVVNFKGPIIFCVVSRYHGGAYVVFSKTLNDSLQALALEGSFASVIGGAPAAAVVFRHEVNKRVQADTRVRSNPEMLPQVENEKLGEVAAEFDAVHTVERAQKVGSLDKVVPAADLRRAVIAALKI